MIYITDAKDCCGCAACEQACPTRCISMQEDREWFLYPEVDASTCIGCGLCERVCPVRNSHITTTYHKVFAVKAKDNSLRITSSSGGIFTLLAEKIIENGGVVFGAKYDDDWSVVHSWTETKQGLKQFRGSKYVQSRIGNMFKEAEKFIKQGRSVLFSGTPCQINGLRLFLRKNYDKLILVEVACHGVPSPGIWRRYLQEIINRPERMEGQEKNTVWPLPKDMPVITGINFRDKCMGWEKYSFVVRGKYAGTADKNLVSDIHSQNPYMRAFLSNLSLRPSCYDCHSRLGYSGSDLTIADYWGVSSVHPEFNDDAGVSLVIINTKKGEEFFRGLDVYKCDSDLKSALSHNPCLIKSVELPKKRDSFFYSVSHSNLLSQSVSNCTKQSLPKSLYKYWKTMIKSIILRLK